MTDKKTASTRKIFLGIGAVVSRLDGKHDRDQTSRCAVNVYLQSGNVSDFTNGPKVPIDMENCAREDLLAFDEIQVDDFGVDWNGLSLLPDASRADGIIVTSIGPRWPNDAIFGGFVGALYLESSYFLQHRTTIEQQSTWPPTGIPGLSPAQLVTVRYDGGTNHRGQDKRFVGFQGVMRRSTVANTYRLQLRIPETTSLSQEFDLPVQDVDSSIGIDLLSFLDPTGGAAYPTLSPNPANAQPGDAVTVFIEITAAAKLIQYGVRSPKIPFFMGARP